jgi:hypothetical protein
VLQCTIELKAMFFRRFLLSIRVSAGPVLARCHLQLLECGLVLCATMCGKSLTCGSNYSYNYYITLGDNENGYCDMVLDGKYSLIP